VHTSTSPYLLETASIDWGDDNVPRSSLYGDVYYCREHGLAETRYVFLEQNSLAERFSAVADHTTFTIAETGFGTGLNFLAAWQLWREQVKPSSLCRLHFVSVEKHPLFKADLQRALAQWPELAELSQTLEQAYPELVAGQHRLEFDDGRVVLDLLFSDAEAGFASLQRSHHPLYLRSHAAVDAWFLDGFAPGSNPGMWSDSLFNAIAALSKTGSSFATFTAAGFVKRALQERGFSVEKVPGFGRKRDMLRGRFSPTARPAPTQKRLRVSENAAWHLPEPMPRPASVAVVGAGLAGCHTAAALAKRGIRVTVLEQGHQVAGAASGNPQAILYTKLSHQAGQLNQFALSSFLHACRFYRAMPDLPGDLCGVLQLVDSTRQEQLDKLRGAFARQDDWCQFVSSEEASAIAGIDLASPAVYFRQAGWLRPAALCKQLLSHPNISVLTGHALHELRQQARGWQLQCENGASITVDAVVLANSHHAMGLPQCAHLPLKIIRGQLTLIPDSEVSALPRSVVCHEGYIAPPVDNEIVIGASYDTRSADTALRDEDNEANLQKLQEAIPGITFSARNTPYKARASLRCTSPDYLPLIGPAPIAEQQLKTFAPLAKDAKTLVEQRGAYYPGLYLNLGHGSRGLTSTPLAAEIVAAQLCSEVPPLPRDLTRALSPSRFLIRSLVRGR